MRKNFLKIGAFVCAMTIFSGCVEEKLTPEAAGGFTVIASLADTKTVNAGMSTNWTAGDNLSLFYVETGGSVYDAKHCGEFTLTDAATGAFSGTLPEALDMSKSYDWYFVYPYNAENSAANAVKLQIGHAKDETIVQNGNNSMAHLAGRNLPMVGYVKNVPATDIPSANMKHLAAVWEIEVVNKTDQVMRVDEITLPATLDGFYRVGACTFNFAEFTYDNPVRWWSHIQYDNEFAQMAPTMTAENTELIPIGGSAKFYIPCFPFPYNADDGNFQRISVNGLSKDLDVSAGMTMLPGQIRRLKFNYDTNLLLNYTDYEFLKEIHDNEYLDPTDGKEMVANINWSACNGDGYFRGIKVQQMNDGKYYVTEIYNYDNNEWYPWLKGLPSKIELPELTVLHLKDNPNLKGVELPQVWNTPKLAKLSLENCGLTGVIPQGFADNPSIREFYINGNDFYGALPHEWAAAGKIEIFNILGSPDLGYVVPKDLDVVFAWECTYQGDKSALKMGGTSGNWLGFEYGWGQERYERYNLSADRGNGTVWDDTRLLNGVAMGTTVYDAETDAEIAALEKDNWAWYYSDFGVVTKQMVEWNQADADAYTAKCKAARGL